MPDQYGFDHLGTEVRCIEDGCGLRGFIFALNESKRAKHHQQHVRDETLRREKARRKQAKANLSLARREKALTRKVTEGR